MLCALAPQLTLTAHKDCTNLPQRNWRKPKKHENEAAEFQRSTQRRETLTDMGPHSSMRHPKPRIACCALFCRVPPSLCVGLVAVVLPCWRLPVFGSAMAGFVCRRQACQIVPQACRGRRPLWGRFALWVAPWFALLWFCSVRRHLSLRMGEEVRTASPGSGLTAPR